MKIVKLEAQNVKRLKAVEITPEGNVVVIGGRNAQGKTSLLDAIMYALGGKAAIPDQPVRKGEKQAKIVCTLDDVGLIVTRTFTAKGGGSLVVSNADGAKLPTPQAILDRLTGKLTFDPLAFARDSAKGQLETLKGLVGLDFNEQDAERQAKYDTRTTINRDAKTLEGQLAGLPEHPDAPVEEVSLSALVGKLEEAREHNMSNEHVRAERVKSIEQLKGIAAKADHAREQIAQWQVILDEAAEDEREARRILAAYQPIESLQDIDLDPIKQQMETAEVINQGVRENQARANITERIAVLQAESSDLTKSIEAIDEEKAVAVAAATLPIKGLAFDDNCVLYSGIPFDQCSSAEQLRVSVAMGLAMNPKLKVLLIRDGSLLDAHSMRIIAEMAEAHDAQVWIEKVSEGAECQVVIEDGMVKAEPGKEGAE